MALDEKTHRVFLVTANFGPPPPPTAEHPHPRGPVLPASFVLLMFGEWRRRADGLCAHEV